MEDRYWIAFVQGRCESAGVERELAREHVLNIAQSKYKQSAAMYPNGIVMLCDRATVLARSDRNPAYTAMCQYQGRCLHSDPPSWQVG